MANPRRIGFLVGALLFTVLAVPAPASSSVSKRNTELEGKYIITLKPNLDNSATGSHLACVSNLNTRNVAKRETVGIEKTYEIGEWKAYAGEFDDATIKEIKANPEASKVHLSLAYIWLTAFSGRERRSR